MSAEHLWIEGNSCCGKTYRLAEKIITSITQSQFPQKPLIISFNQENKKNLGNILLSCDRNIEPQKIRTPSGLMIEDVFLFYPLICQQLSIKPKIPFRLLSETEQELATQLWRSDLTTELLALFGGEYNTVRRILDFMQLSASAGIPYEKITQRLYASETISDEEVADTIGDLILKWRQWCLEKSLLSYGLIYELYWRYLLPLPEYRSYLGKKYTGVFADDVDNFPAIIADLAQIFIDNDKWAVFTYNQQGQVRLGFNADPDSWLKISSICQQEYCLINKVDGLVTNYGESLINVVKGEYVLSSKLKDNFQVIKTQTRGDLFPTTVDFIAQAIEQKKVKPNEIAIIAAGLDEIARYSLQSSFNQHHIESRFLQEQRPLITSAIVRGILTLICFIYEDLGKLLTKDMVTEMLVVLSHRNIDLVRSGLLVDYCYVADLKQPHLLNLDQFPYWQRLNVDTVEAYQPIVEWINEQAQQVKTNQLDFFCLVDNIIDRFFPSQSLNYTQLSNLRFKM